MAEPQDDRTGAVALMESRKALYDFLSNAYFEEMTLGFLEGLRDRSQGLGPELEAFSASLVGADLEEVRTDLAVEYARLFLNMSPNPVPPYESVYTGELPVLMQEARDQVLAVYRSEGVAVVTEVKIPEDHVALEFAFMAAMCQKTADALAAGDEDEADRCLDVQAAFVNDHLAPWVPRLCDDVRARSGQRFYRDVADLTVRFLDSERSLLAE